MSEKEVDVKQKLLHPSYFNDVLRTWQTRTSKLNADCLIYPVFIHYDSEIMEEIDSMPGQYRVGYERVVDYLKPMVENGLKTILLFGIIPEDLKTIDGRAMFDKLQNPVFLAITVIKEAYPDLVVACDVCQCAYTDHGHCYTLNRGKMDMEDTLLTLVTAAKMYAIQGADIVAPSDMMDGRVAAIHKRLLETGLRSKVSIMSYSAKFASCFYGPFRDAAKSAPRDGDRKAYQLPAGSRMLAKRAARRDIEEGADIIMVKPGMPFLDIVRDLKDQYPDYPLAIYQVSGEFAMLYHASKAGALDLRKAVIESIESMHRAGADIVISYFTPQILEWLKEPKQNKHLAETEEP